MCAFTVCCVYSSCLARPWHQPAQSCHRPAAMRFVYSCPQSVLFKHSVVNRKPNSTMASPVRKHPERRRYSTIILRPREKRSGQQCQREVCSTTIPTAARPRQRHRRSHRRSLELLLRPSRSRGQQRRCDPGCLARPHRSRSTRTVC